MLHILQPSKFSEQHIWQFGLLNIVENLIKVRVLWIQLYLILNKYKPAITIPIESQQRIKYLVNAAMNTNRHRDQRTQN